MMYDPSPLQTRTNIKLSNLSSHLNKSCSGMKRRADCHNCVCLYKYDNFMFENKNLMCRKVSQGCFKGRRRNNQLSSVSLVWGSQTLWLTWIRKSYWPCKPNITNTYSITILRRRFSWVLLFVALCVIHVWLLPLTWEFCWSEARVFTCRFK
jgi:hypothetical protein